MWSAITRRAVACLSACVCAITSPALAGTPTRPPQGGLVSTALCADSYVLALAGPGQIRALSWQVDQPVSAAPDWARDMPQAWPDAERLLTLQPGLAVFDPGGGGRTARLLSRAGIAVHELDWVDGFDGIRRNLGALGVAMERADEADALVDDLESRLAGLAERSATRGAPVRVLYLNVSGGSAGAETYVDAAIRAAGGVNVMAEAGHSGWTRSDPEVLLDLDVDLVLTSFFSDGYASTSNHARHHAAYRHVLAGRPRVDIPAGYWPCAGPRLVDAAEAIADALDSLAVTQ